MKHIRLVCASIFACIVPILLLSYPFGSTTGITTGTHPHGVAAADLNADGKTDLVSANTESNGVSVFLGNGDGTFQPRVDYAVQSRPKFVVIGDVNNDGKLDLAVANETSYSVTVLLGNGNGTFQAGIHSPAGCLEPHEIAIGDVNNDGIVDAVIPCWGGNYISVLRGIGNGSFQPAINYTTGSAPHSAAIADYNKDGRNDVAIANFRNNTMSILLQQANGSLGGATNYATALQPHFVRAADLNKDGNLDLFTANDGADNVSVFLGTGTGTVSPAVNYATGHAPESAIAADINGDGNLDLITANSTGGNISVLLGSGTGSFAAPANHPAGNTPFHTVAAHFNGDGQLDIAVANYGADNLSLLLTSSGNPLPPGGAYLSDRAWTSATNGVGPVERDRANGNSAQGDGAILALNGTTHLKGLGVHANSTIQYAVSGCTGFTSSVGVDDEVGNQGSVVFQVWVDSLKQFDSGIMRGTSATQQASVNLTGASEMRLVVTVGGDGDAYDHADWASAIITCGVDGNPPTVSGFTPAANATAVAPSSPVSVTFSEPMTAASITTTTFTLLRQGTVIPVVASVSYDNATRTATLSPSAPLELGAQYVVTVKGGASGVKDVASNPLTADHMWTFTTATQAPTYLSDLQWLSATNGWGPVERDRANGDSAAGDGPPLRLNGTTFAKGLGAHAASDIRYSVAGCASFSAQVGVDDAVNTFGSIVFQVWTDGVKVSETPTLTGSSVPFPINVDLTGKAELRLVVTDGGNGISYDHADWADAKISCSPDAVPPTVTATTPTAGATNVSVGAIVSASFNEPMTPGTITSGTFTLTREGTTTPVPATVVYDGSTQRASLTPQTSLQTNTLYHALVKGGTNGVTDANGNALLSDFAWSFTTSATAETTTFLSDRTWTSAVNGWGPVEKDRANGDLAANDGQPMRLNGVLYTKGLGTHANSDIRFNVTGCTSMTADVGVDDEVGTFGSVIFQVWGDSIKLFESTVMTGASATQPVSVNLTGRTELRLVVTNAGDNINYDHANWGNARITCN